MMRANWELVSEVVGERVLIRDLGPWDEWASVTNAAGTVVRELAAMGKLPAGCRLLYVDSDGRTDEILVRDGMFAGFRILERAVGVR